MSWEGDNNGDSDPLPVDTLVKDLRDVLDDFNGVCSGKIYFYLFVCLVPSTIFQLNRDGSSWVEPILS